MKTKYRYIPLIPPIAFTQTSKRPVRGTIKSRKSSKNVKLVCLLIKYGQKVGYFKFENIDSGSEKCNNVAEEKIGKTAVCKFVV